MAMMKIPTELPMHRYPSSGPRAITANMYAVRAKIAEPKQLDIDNPFDISKMTGSGRRINTVI